MDPWWDDPAYKAAQGTFRDRGAFSPSAKLKAQDVEKLQEVLTDLCRDAIPAPEDITRFEWETILRYLGAAAEEIRDVQVRMGRVWR